MTVASAPPAHFPLRLREVDPDLDERWDRYVGGHPDGTVFHHSGWLRALRREYDREQVALAVEDERGELRGVLPLMATRGVPLARGDGLAGRRLSSLPRTPVAGPIGDDPRALRALVVGAVERVPPRAQLQLKLAQPRLDGLVEGLVGHAWREAYVLQLPERPDDVRHGPSRNHARIRSSVRKARHEGVTVRLAETADDVRAWHRLYLDTMRHHFVPARPLRFVEALWDAFRPRDMFRLLLAEHRGQMLGGLLMLTSGSTVFDVFNGVARSSFAHATNDVLHWESIRMAAADGFSRYDLGEVVESRAGLAFFKRKWGAEPQRLHRYYFPPPKQAPSTGAGAPGKLAALAHAAWRRMPLSLTAVAGDLAYRRL